MKLPPLQSQKQLVTALLRECIALGSQAHVISLQENIRKWNLEQVTLVGNLLIQMHATFGRLEQAQESFDRIGQRNVFSWTILLAAYAQNGHLDHAEAILEKMPHRNTVSWNCLISSCARFGDRNKSLLLYRRMDLAGEKPNHMTLLAVVEASGIVTAEQGKLVQQRIVETGFLTENSMLGNSLVSMHGRSGRVEQALDLFESLIFFHRDVVTWNAMLTAAAHNGCLSFAKACFDRMPGRVVVSWNSMMTAFARNGRPEDAVLLFQEMDSTGDVNPSEASFVIVLDACATHLLLRQGREIHDSARRRGLDRDKVVGTLLVNMYGKCGSLLEAEAVFSLLQQPSLVAWNAMISAFVVQQERSSKTRPDYFTAGALELLQRMDLDGCQADEITIVSVANACRNFFIAKLVFSSIEMVHCFEKSVFVNTAFISAFAMSGSLLDAVRVFQEMPERSTVSWNSMLSALVQHGATLQALELFRNMDLDGVPATAVTIITMLEICPDHQHLRLGEKIHAAVMDSNLEVDALVSSALISMYGKCKDLEAARKVFDKVQDHPSTMASITAMLTALSQNGALEQARELFEKMPVKNLTAWNSMISAYVQNSEDEKAVSIFLDMLVDGCAPDNVTFTSLLGSSSELPLYLVKLLHSTIVEEEVELDEFAASALVKSYGKCGDFASATAIFYERLPAGDPASWNVVIATCAQNGYPRESITFFRRMLADGVRPNLITFANALDSCSNLAEVTLATLLHSMIVESRLHRNELVNNALVNLYGKCGSSSSALEVFASISSDQRTVVSWTSIITAVSESGGDPAEAVEFFHQMNLEGVVADQVTFMSLLSALSHAGQFQACLDCFLSMQPDFTVAATAEHYACMVNLLGRAGELSRAEELIGNMPYEPGYLVWMMLLGASGIHSSSTYGWRAANNVLTVDTQAAAVPYVLLSNLFAADLVPENSYPAACRRKT